MRLGTVEIPDALVEAHRDGKLVLFVGAGASVAAPSNLPTVRGLVDRIAEDSGRRCPDGGCSPDEVLDRLKHDGVDVHLRVREIVGCGDSKPNPLHKAIIDLAVTSGKIRVVTTNYDRHLSACLEDDEVEEFSSPTLPGTEDFTGIVYLHGHVDQAPDRLVVTGADFGKWYLNDSRVTGFLGWMHRALVVLFIGYSHRDTLMKYLGKGLPEGSNRFALCLDPDDERWRELQIDPIGYPNHEDLPTVIRRWAERARMTPLDHDQRVRTIVKGALPLSSEDESYLEEAVSHPVRVRSFVESAHGVDWLRWMEDRPPFGCLFDPSASLDGVGTALAWWFSDRYAANPELTVEALRVVGERGGGLSQTLWRKIAGAVAGAMRHTAAGSSELGRWIPLLISGAMPPDGWEHIVMLLRSCDPLMDPEATLLLFDRLTQPVPVLSGVNLMPLAQPRVDAVIKKGHSVRDIWNRLSKTALPDLASDLARVLDRNLRHAHRIAWVGSASEDGWTSLSRRRPAIEPHEQNLPGSDRIAPLIDAARDVLEALLQPPSDEGQHYLRTWGKAPEPLLRRLAIHGWIERADVHPDKKLTWIIQHADLFDIRLRHETMRLLAKALPRASEECSNAVVEYVVQGPARVADYTDFVIYNYLAWIIKHAPELGSAREAWKSARDTHPDWSPLAHPDFPNWVGPSPLHPVQTVTPGELHQLTSESPEKAVALLTECLDVESGPGPQQIAVFKTLNATVEEHTADGLALLEVLTGPSRHALDSDQRLAEGILGCWTTDAPSLPYDDIVPLLPSVWETGTARWTTESSIAEHHNECQDSGWGIGEGADQLTLARSHWSGMIAQIVLNSSVADTRQAAANHTGLSPSARSVLEKLLHGSGRHTDYAQVVAAERLYYLFGADPQWCLEWILPLLDPGKGQDRAIRCWNGYLPLGQFNLELLEAGLINHYVSAAEVIHRLTSETQCTYHAHLTLILRVFGPDVGSGWLKRFTNTADTDTRVHWMRSVGSNFTAMSAEEVEAQWEAWMRTYWKNRLLSIPVAMTPDEASAMAEWTVTLGPSFAEAVDLAVQHDASLDEHSRVLFWLDTSVEVPGHHPRPDYLTEYPKEVAKLLTHMLSHTEKAPPSSSYHFDRIVQRLRGSLGEKQLNPLLNEAISLGLER